MPRRARVLNFAQRFRQAGVEFERGHIGSGRLGQPTADLECVAELDMRIRILVVDGDCASIRRFSFLDLSAFLERMAVLDPDRRAVGIQSEGLFIGVGGTRPITGIPQRIGRRNGASCRRSGETLDIFRNVHGLAFYGYDGQAACSRTPAAMSQPIP